MRARMCATAICKEDIFRKYGVSVPDGIKKYKKEV